VDSGDERHWVALSIPSISISFVIPFGQNIRANLRSTDSSSVSLWHGCAAFISVFRSRVCMARDRAFVISHFSETSPVLEEQIVNERKVPGYII